MIEINKEIMYKELIKKIEKIFSLPETYAVTIKDIVIEKSQNKSVVEELVKQAVALSYHDVLSDVDISVRVRLPRKNGITSVQYVKRLDRYGITRNCYLGLMFIPENMMYRIILKNGMRYDLGFDFLYDESVDYALDIPDKDSENCHEKWSLDDVDRFWFVQIQALAKLYRKDFLIGDHLANLNINETLVQQMVLRDIKYETNFHRYGYEEELEYLKAGEEKCPYKRENPIFNSIAGKIYAASIAYDKLTRQFYPEYKERRYILFDIWKCYDKSSSV